MSRVCTLCFSARIFQGHYLGDGAPTWRHRLSCSPAGGAADPQSAGQRSEPPRTPAGAAPLPPPPLPGLRLTLLLTSGFEMSHGGFPAVPQSATAQGTSADASTGCLEKLLTAAVRLSIGNLQIVAPASSNQPAPPDIPIDCRKDRCCVAAASCARCAARRAVREAASSCAAAASASRVSAATSRPSSTLICACRRQHCCYVVYWGNVQG